MNTTNNLSATINQNLVANIMAASGNLPVALSKAQRNLADMYLDHLKATYGDEEAQKRFSIPAPIFISHPAYTEISLVNHAPMALGAPSSSFLRVVYFSGRMFTPERAEPTDTSWIRPALDQIFAAQPFVLFQDDHQLTGQFAGLGGTWNAVDKVLEEPDTDLVFYGAVAATEFYQNHSVQKLYFVYHDKLRLFLVDAFGWDNGAPGAHRLIAFSIEALGFYQNHHPDGLVMINPQTNEQFRRDEVLSTGMTSVWVAPTGMPAGTYAFRANPRNPGDWQYRMTSHTPGDVPVTGTVAEEILEDVSERRELALKLFQNKHENLGQQAYDYGLLVTIMARQVARDLLRDVFIDDEGSLVMDVGLGPAADERFVFRTWRGDVQFGVEVKRVTLVEPTPHVENLDHVSEAIFEEATHARHLPIDDGMELLEAHAVPVESTETPTSIEVVDNYIAPKLEEQTGSLLAVGASSYVSNLFDQFKQAKLQGDVDRMQSIFNELKVTKIAASGDTKLFDLLPELELAAKIAIDEAKVCTVVSNDGGEQVTGDRNEYLNRHFMLAMQGGDLDLMERLFPQIEAQLTEAKTAGAPQKVIDELESAVHNCRKNIEVVKARQAELENNLKDLGIEKPENAPARLQGEYLEDELSSKVLKDQKPE